VAVFHLKYRDTYPVLEVELLNPDGTVHDLGGAFSVTLHIRLSDGSATLSRAMTIYDSPNGIVRYAWQTTDWTTGGLVVGPSVPLAPGVVEHRMEYEVVGPGSNRLTFPNYGYDTLRIITDFGQAT
jgi:hypothetical protein